MDESQDSERKPPRSRRKPPSTPEGRENQLVSLAMDLAEKQLREGTASAQVISHYLKLGSSREILEQQRLASENELLGAKVGQIANTASSEEMYRKALTAMSQYAGHKPPNFGDDDED